MVAACEANKPKVPIGVHHQTVMSRHVQQTGELECLDELGWKETDDSLRRGYWIQSEAVAYSLCLRVRAPYRVVDPWKVIHMDFSLADCPVNCISLMPIHYSHHWILLVADPTQREAEAFDSYREYAREIRGDVLELVRQRLSFLWRKKIEITLKACAQQGAGNDTASTTGCRPWAWRRG
jgi:hypothetical protein